MSSFSENLLVSELINLISTKFSCRDVSEEIPDILINLANKIAKELEFLEKERDFVKERCVLLEKIVSVEKIRDLTFQGNLVKSLKECEKLREEIASLRENERTVNEKLKRASDISGRFNEKDQIIELKKKLSEKDQIIKTHETKVKYFEEQEGHVKKQILILKGHLSRDDKLIAEMKSEKFKDMEEKKRIAREWTSIMEEIKKKICEKDQVIKTYQEKVKCFDKKEKQVEQDIQVLKDQISKGDQIIDEMKKQHSKFLDEKNKEIRELNDDMSKQLKQVVEQEHVGKEQLKCLNKKVGPLEWKNKDLEGRILIADQTIIEMKSEQLKVSDENNKLNKEIDKLRKKVLDQDQAIEMYKVQLESLNGKVVQLERKDLDSKSQISRADQELDEMKRVQSKTDLEKKSISAGLNESIAKLKNEMLKKNQYVEACEEKFKSFLANLELVETEVQGLKRQKVAADQMIETMKGKQLAADERIKNMKSKLEEADHVIQNMKCNQQEAEELIEKMKSQQSKSNNTMEELREHNLEATKIVETLRSQVLDAHVARKARDVSNSKGEKRNLRIRIKQTGAGKNDVRVVRSTTNMVPSTCNSTKRTSSGLHKMGGEIHRDPCGVNAESQHQASPSRCGPVAENSCIDTANECKRLKLTVETHSNIQGVAVRDSSENSRQDRGDGYSSEARITVVDQENESRRLEVKDPFHGNVEQDPVIQSTSSPSSHENASYPVHINVEQDPVIQPTFSHEIVGEEEMNICEKAPSSSQPITPISFVQNRIPITLSPSDSDDSDLDSTDPDDQSFSETAINDILANVRCLKLCNNWMSIDEIQNDLEKDIQFCMNAVCVLYRHTLDNPGKLVHFDAMGGSNLAEYLINGDPKHRLRKLLSEFKQERPDDLALCCQLASNYSDKLFWIYRNGKDPLFKLM